MALKTATLRIRIRRIETLVQGEGTACVGCGRVKHLAAKGLCWGCYARVRKGRAPAPAASSERPAKAPPRPPAASSERPATTRAEDADLAAVGDPDPAVHRPAAARVAAKIRARREPERDPSGAPSSGATDLRRAIRALALTPRDPLNPEGFDHAVEEVLRTAQVAGWLDPDPSAPGRREREREDDPGGVPRPRGEARRSREDGGGARGGGG